MKPYAVLSDITEMPACGSPLEAYRGKRVLVTGGRGFIGAALSQALASVSCHLTILDRSGQEAWIPAGVANVSIVVGDVRQRGTWDRVLSGVDIVFHLAQQEYVQCDPLMDWNVNALPTVHLCESCRENNWRPLVVFSSSANLYGQVDTLPVSEKSRDEPLIPWAIHKQMAEAYLHAYAAKFGLSAVILRLANVYGPSPRKDVVFRPAVNAAIHDAMQGKSLQVFSNSHCIRDYVFVDDVIQALLLAGQLRSDAGGEVFNIGSAVGTTIHEAWQTILDAVAIRLARHPSMDHLPIEVEPFGLRNFVADISKFGKLTGWRPEVFFKSGIERTIDYILSLPARS